MTFTDLDIGGAAPPLPRQAPPLPTGLPPMMPMAGAGPRPMPFPGAFFSRPMHMPPVPAARNHDQLVQAFKDLLLEVKVACNAPPPHPPPQLPFASLLGTMIIARPPAQPCSSCPSEHFPCSLHAQPMLTSIPASRAQRCQAGGHARALLAETGYQTCWLKLLFYMSRGGWLAVVRCSAQPVVQILFAGWLMPAA